MIKKKVGGVPMWLDPGDGGISGALASKGIREQAFMKVLEMEGCGPLILDVGANIGYTLLQIWKNHKDAKFLAYEPDRRSFKLLKKNIELNKITNVELSRLALSDSIDEQIIYLSKRPNLSSIHQPRGDSTKAIIKTDTIDNIFSKRNDLPSFIKMDIEGHEVSVLRGGMKTFKRCKNVKILLETHQQFYNKGNNFEKVLRDLVSIGFKFKWIVSAAVPVPDAFKKAGYKPTIKVPNFGRAIFSDLKVEDAIRFASQQINQVMPHKNNRVSKKIVRSICLVK